MKAQLTNTNIALSYMPKNNFSETESTYLQYLSQNMWLPCLWMTLGKKRNKDDFQFLVSTLVHNYI